MQDTSAVLFLRFSVTPSGVSYMHLVRLLEVHVDKYVRVALLEVPELCEWGMLRRLPLDHPA